MDYEVRRSARHCAASGREFSPGKEFFSVLVAKAPNCAASTMPSRLGKGRERRDRLVEVASRRAKTPNGRNGLPNDVLLQCFDELADQPERQDMRYVLACCSCGGASCVWRKMNASPTAARFSAALPAPRRQL